MMENMTVSETEIHSILIRLLKNISLLKVNLTTLQYLLVSCLLPSHIITKHKQYRNEYIN